MKYYHATSKRNRKSILEKGLLTGIDGVVYLTKKPDECLRFMAFRFDKYIDVYEVNIPKSEKNKVMESFDHNENIFKCKAYMYLENVPVEWIKLHSEYKRNEDE